jgi:two-component system invasion response regulator UvrY
MKKITILIADDHTLIRETWSFILNRDPRFEVVAETGSGEEAIELVKKLRPDVTMMDINLPGINGIEATEQIRKYCPAARILAVSLHTQPSYAKEIMKKGAMGYVTKNSSKEEMFQAITEVYNGTKYICSEIKNNLTELMITEKSDEQGINALTQREIQVISLIKKGNSSKEIAESLSISVKTVEVHRYNILKKLNLKNSSALVNYINKHHPSI